MRIFKRCKPEGHAHWIDLIFTGYQCSKCGCRIHGPKLDRCPECKRRMTTKSKEDSKE